MCWISTSGFSLECLFYVSQSRRLQTLITHKLLNLQFLSSELGPYFCKLSGRLKRQKNFQYFDICTGFVTPLESLGHTVIFLL